MKRDLMGTLIAWKNSKARKPLIIKGARQVGKTWLMKEFGQLHYAEVAYFNFESNAVLRSIFLGNYDTTQLITALRIESGKSLDPKTTLIVFDEIQECEGALTSLKYFQENAPEYHIVAAGSLLGVAMNRTQSFPVGKVDFLELYPLSFREFLDASDKSDLLKLLDSANWSMITAFRERFMDSLRQYYFVGGMPEAVLSFTKYGNLEQVREIQLKILAAYEQDFSKHAPSVIVPRMRMVWQSIPSQLAKENRKFIYGAVKQGARAKDFELALAWLSDAGLVHKVHCVTKPGIPLIAYQDLSAFKLYLLDVGLLTAMGNLDSSSLLQGNNLLQEFKGALTEQYVLQQLKCTDHLPIFYWSAERAKAEVDFVIQDKNKVIPLEVKAEENLKSKSLRVYHDAFQPPVSYRLSMSNYREQEWMINIPLYAVNHVLEK